ncbi:MAG TPA: hypothetical protein VFG55_03350 [Rhodanobacteraceae bacterium]|nr:hypothetical protein [Rhodanobacteraceae bacterium]
MSGRSREVVLRFLAEPADVNFGGTVHGAVFVALDGAEGKPSPVPAWQPRNQADRELAGHAQRLLELSRAMERQVAGFRPARKAAD